MEVGSGRSYGCGIAAVGVDVVLCSEVVDTGTLVVEGLCSVFIVGDR